MLYVKPERKTNVFRKVPVNIKLPSENSMETCYQLNDEIYAVRPFIDKKNEFAFSLLCKSFLFYGIACYDANTGRLKKVIYTDRDKQTVDSKFVQLRNNQDFKKIDNPYHLYFLRIQHGYYY